LESEKANPNKTEFVSGKRSRGKDISMIASLSSLFQSGKRSRGGDISTIARRRSEQKNTPRGASEKLKRSADMAQAIYFADTSTTRSRSTKARNNN